MIVWNTWYMQCLLPSPSFISYHINILVLWLKIRALKKKKRDQILKHCNTTHLYIIHHTSMRTKQHRLHKTSTWAQAPAQIYQTLWIHSSTGISDLGLVVKDSWLFNPTIVCLVVLSLTPSGPHFWGAWTILIFNCRNISLHVFFML